MVIQLKLVHGYSADQTDTADLLCLAAAATKLVTNVADKLWMASSLEEKSTQTR